jgi:hypothetical protein
MRFRTVCTILAASALIAAGVAIADDMGGMNMGASSASPGAASSPAGDMSAMPNMDMSKMMKAAQIDPSNMKEGEMDAMSMMTMRDMHMDHDMSMGNMAQHMTYTTLRPENAADRKRADEVVDQLKLKLAKYQDYHAAEAAGFKPFHPEIKQMEVVHFTKYWYGLKAAFVFNPEQPTSLLYERTKGDGYKLIGAMYTDRKHATEDQLNERVPLSVARWHRHIKLCFPKKGTDPATVDWTKFGFNGSIATKVACSDAGGRFYPQVFGWMVHVYPWDTNPNLVWAK